MPMRQAASAPPACESAIRCGILGVENELYHGDHTWLLFGDAKDSLTKLAYGFKRGWGG